MLLREINKYQLHGIVVRVTDVKGRTLHVDKVDRMGVKIGEGAFRLTQSTDPSYFSKDRYYWITYTMVGDGMYVQGFKRFKTLQDYQQNRGYIWRRAQPVSRLGGMI